MAHPQAIHTTKTTLALALLAAATTALLLHTPTTDTTASNRETGTVKVEASAGDKKVEVIKA
ncbi:hypothetical protein OG357_27665 [Streptomyces sp. NBC_01255]|uniref:hypothetical protein n=1 Tax=Streptomyces sp. NBC_01255 TaxID=2903798 RepID=UPI002E312080|nr:hypothetical protein [Streptomyces sp. NBC_01255]